MEVAIFAFEEDMCIAANNRDSHFYTPNRTFVLRLRVQIWRIFSSKANLLEKIISVKRSFYYCIIWM